MRDAHADRTLTHVHDHQVYMHIDKNAIIIITIILLHQITITIIIIVMITIWCDSTTRCTGAVAGPPRRPNPSPERWRAAAPVLK